MIQAKAPGTLFLFGEHAVLQGQPAIVAAIDAWLTVTLTPKAHSNIFIRSAALQRTLEFSINNIPDDDHFRFVLEALRFYQHLFLTGFELIIESDMPPTVGFGTSVAVTVATHLVFRQWLAQSLKQEDIFKSTHQTILNIQKIASGADIAASLCGGVTEFFSHSLEFKKIHDSLPLAILYQGHKTPTTEVIATVQSYMQEEPEVLQSLYATMGIVTRQAQKAIIEDDWEKLGSLMNVYAGLQNALGVSTATTEILLEQLRLESTIYGAKQSGSGLGDCIIGLGHINPHTFPNNSAQAHLNICQFDLTTSPTGATLL